MYFEPACTNMCLIRHTFELSVVQKSLSSFCLVVPRTALLIQFRCIRSSQLPVEYYMYTYQLKYKYKSAARMHENIELQLQLFDPDLHSCRIPCMQGAHIFPDNWLCTPFVSNSDHRSLKNRSLATGKKYFRMTEKFLVP